MAIKKSGDDIKRDRFLLAIIAGIALLVILSLVLFFSRRGDQEYGPDGTHQGVVTNYILALQKADYEKAFAYLGDIDRKPDFEDFQSHSIALRPEVGRVVVQFGDTDQTGKVAAVTLTIVHPGNGPFNSGWEENTRAQLRQDDSGSWKIIVIPYPFWDPSWTSSKILAP